MKVRGEWSNKKETERLSIMKVSKQLKFLQMKV